jgi:hypothetical protein
MYRSIRNRGGRLHRGGYETVDLALARCMTANRRNLVQPSSKIGNAVDGKRRSSSREAPAGTHRQNLHADTQHRSTWHGRMQVFGALVSDEEDVTGGSATICLLLYERCVFDAFGFPNSITSGLQDGYKALSSTTRRKAGREELTFPRMIENTWG